MNSSAPGNESDRPVTPNQLAPTGRELAQQSAYAAPAPVWLDHSGQDDGVDFMAFLHSARRTWLPATLAGGVMATLVAALLWLLIPVKSEAVALLRVNMRQRDVIGGRTNSLSDQREYAVFKQTQATTLKSPFVLSAALREPAIANLSMIRSEDKPLAMLEKELRAEYPGDSEIMRVSLAGDNDKEVVAIVDAVVKAYVDEVSGSERQGNVSRLDTLRKRFRANSTEMTRLTDEIQKLALEIGTGDSQQAALNQQLAQGELHRIETERASMKRQVEELQSQLFVLENLRRSRMISASPNQMADLLERDPIYFQAKQQASELQRQLQLYSGVTKGRSGPVAQMQQELASHQQVMQQRERELRPRLMESIRKAYGSDENQETSELMALQSSLYLAQQRLDALNAEYDQQVQKVRDLTGFSAELVTKQATLETLRAATDELSLEIARLEVNMETPARIQQIQPAIIPDFNSTRIKIVEVIAGWLGTFLLALVGFAGWDFLSKRLNTVKDLESNVGIPVIGSVPSIRSGMMGGSARESLVVDAVDSLRAAINYGSRGRDIKSIVVTSALGHEGKTTVASQLAVSFARGGKRTLLVDGDVRNPQQHAVFGLPADRGLCDVLRGTAKLEEVVQATPAENLWILPAGRCDAASFQAISGPGVARAMERLRAQFDFVIVDSGPVLTGPEALIFGQHVDGALLSTRRDYSRLPKVDEAARRLRSVGVPVIGSVVNGANSEARASAKELPSVG